MTIRNVNWARAEDISAEDRVSLGITAEEGLVAIETHNSDYEQKGTAVGSGVLEYIWSLQ